MYQPQHAAKAAGASPEPRVLCFGEKVQYLSRRTGQWIPAVVQGHAMVAVPGAGTPEEFHYQLDVQEAAHPSRVRAAESQPKQATTPAPAVSVPVAQPCKESQQHPVEQLHQPKTNLPQQAQPPPAPLPPPASAPAPLCPVRSAAAPISKQPPARWQLMCLYAEGFSQEVLHALPSTMRALPIPDGKSHLGRQHQAKFLEALLVKSPQLLSIISRTHADVEAPANSSKVRFTNLTLNPVFVNSVQALWQGQSGELGPGTTLSFARNQGDDTPHHFLIFQLQALDAGLQCLQSSAETETKAAAREHQPPSAAARAIPPEEQPPLPQPPPSAMAMTTVDVAKVAIPTEVLQQLRAVETCKLDSPKPKDPPREPSPDPSPGSDQVSKAPPEPRSFLQSMDKEKKADPQPEALQPKGKEPNRAALGAVDAKAALDPVAFEETLPVAPAPTLGLGPCPVLGQLPEEVAVEDATGTTSIEPHITLELNGAGVKAEASLASRRLGSWALSSPLAVGRRHQADQLRSVIVRECLQFISRDHFAVEFRDEEACCRSD
ncbi:rbcL [Symbiodinium sp. CCMP2592]|nr:rbcL [Symbiodinium sp. CCMP2592]